MKKLMMVLGALCFVPCAAWAATIDVTQANFEQNRTLQNGNTYRFVEDVTFTAGSSASALKVENSATVTLEIPLGVTVTLKGGDASATIGAGAGIEVPSNSKLTIKGEGTLNATGGNAANGGVGGAGGTGVVNKENGTYRSGKGGKGGFGGGGGAGGGAGGGSGCYEWFGAGRSEAATKHTGFGGGGAGGGCAEWRERGEHERNVGANQGGLRRVCARQPA